MVKALLSLQNPTQLSPPPGSLPQLFQAVGSWLFCALTLTQGISLEQLIQRYYCICVCVCMCVYMYLYMYVYINTVVVDL